MTRTRRVRSTWFGVLAAALLAGGCGGAGEDGQGGSSSSSDSAGSASSGTGRGSTSGGGGGGGGSTNGGGSSTTGGGNGGSGGNTASNEVGFGPAFRPGAPIGFGPVAVGSSRTITLTLRNFGGDMPRTINGLAVSGDHASDFPLQAGTCQTGTRLAPGATCAATVTFAPATQGARRAIFTIDAAPCCGRSIQLEGGTRRVPGTAGPATSTPDATTEAQP